MEHENYRRTCAETGKTIYTSKGDAFRSLPKQLGSKTMRYYPCPHHPSHGHLTKEKASRLRGGKPYRRTQPNEQHKYGW